MGHHNLKVVVCLGSLLMTNLCFGQTAAVTSVSAASSAPIVAPDSIVSAWGTGLATATASANIPATGPVTLPNTLGNVQLNLKDSANATSQPVLYMVSPGQINFVLPASFALGVGTVTVGSSSTLTGPLLVSSVAPAVFTVDGQSASVPAAQVVRVTSNAIVSVDPVFQAGTGSSVVARPIVISGNDADSYYLMVYATGIRGRSLNPATATIGDVDVPVTYAGAQKQFPGFDQVNIGPLPSSLRGKGVVNMIIRADGVPANSVKLTLQ